MGTAFASSLLGLAGSLVVGLLELFASQSQNRFYRELEEWLSSITRLGVAGATDFEGAGEGEAAQTAGLVQYMAQQMDGLAQIIARGEQARADTDLRLAALADGVEKLTLALERETAGTGAALGRLADSQATIAERLAPQEPAREAGLFEGEGDPEARMHLRSIDTQLLRLLEEIAAGRQEALTELRTDLQQVSREVRKLTRSVTGVGDPGGGDRSKNNGSIHGPVATLGRTFQYLDLARIVDAMTALLLVLMFVLSIFMIMQFILQETITGQESELDTLNAEVSALASALGLAQERADGLETEVGDL